MADAITRLVVDCSVVVGYPLKAGQLGVGHVR